MINLRSLILMAVVVMVSAQPSTTSLDKSDPEVRAILAEIEADVEQVRQEQKIPGLSIAIVYDQEILLAKGTGFADLENKTLADAKTVYRVGSVTKLFTALMLMQLRDAGKLNLDDPIEKYLPEFKIKSRFPDARPATFRQVAAHTSGLPIEPPMSHEYQVTDKFPSVEEQLKSLKDVEMIAPALIEFNYSNLGYNIMGLALARVAKQPYTKYVENQILRPLRMNQSGFFLTSGMKAHLAIGYKAAGPDGKYERSADPEYGMASGMLYSTVEDMSEFLSLFFREGPAGGKQILGGSSLLEMTVPVIVSTDRRRLWRTGSAIGWVVGPFDGEQMNYKPGGTAGFSAGVFINAQRKLGVAVFTNTECEPFGIGRSALAKLAPVVERVLERKRAAAMMEAVPSWHQYLGRYILADPSAERVLTFREFDINIVDGKLVISVPERLPGSVVNPNETPMEPFGKDTFRLLGGSFYGNFISFEPSQEGDLRLKWRGYTFTRRR